MCHVPAVSFLSWECEDITGFWYPITGYLAKSYVYVIFGSIFPFHSPLDTSWNFIELDQKNHNFHEFSFCVSISASKYHLSYTKVYLHTLRSWISNVRPPNQSTAPDLGAQTAAADLRLRFFEIAIVAIIHPQIHGEFGHVWAENKEFGK